MKKLVSLALSALSAFALLGATMVTVNDPKVGDVAYSGFGRLAYVDVFSTNDTGTVKLDRVFKTVTYTNAYDITTSSETNIVETPVFGDWYYLRHDSVAFTNTFHSFTSSVHTVYEGYYRAANAEDSYLLFKEDWGVWSLYDKGENGGRCDGEEDEPKLLFEKSGNIFERVRDVIRTDVTTNIVTHVTTNAVRAVKCYDLEVTNNVFNGSCSGKFFRGTPDTEFWMFKGDRLLFNGTATGGALRLVIE